MGFVRVLIIVKTLLLSFTWILLFFFFIIYWFSSSFTYFLHNLLIFFIISNCFFFYNHRLLLLTRLLDWLSRYGRGFRKNVFYIAINILSFSLYLSFPFLLLVFHFKEFHLFIYFTTYMKISSSLSFVLHPTSIFFFSPFSGIKYLKKKINKWINKKVYLKRNNSRLVTYIEENRTRDLTDLLK